MAPLRSGGARERAHRAASARPGRIPGKTVLSSETPVVGDAFSLRVAGLVEPSRTGPRHTGVKFEVRGTTFASPGGDTVEQIVPDAASPRFRSDRKVFHPATG